MTEQPSAGSEDDRAIDRMVRDSRVDPDPHFVRPPDATIEAYLLGTATAEQRAEVLDALASSSKFRREVLELSSGIQAVEAHDVSARQSQVDADQVPSLGSFLKDSEKSGSGIGSRPLDSRSSRRRVASWVLYPALGVAAAWFAFLGIREAMQSGTKLQEVRVENLARWQLVEAQVDAGLLVGNTTRDLGMPDSSHLYRAASATAIDAFRQAVTLGDGEFRMRPNLPQPAWPADWRTVVVRIFDEGGSMIQTLAFGVPPSVGAGGDETVAWLLKLPQRSLYSTPFLADTVDCLLPEVGLQEVGVTITFPMTGKYRASGVISLR